MPNEKNSSSIKKSTVQIMLSRQERCKISYDHLIKQHKISGHLARSSENESLFKRGGVNMRIAFLL